MPASVYTIVANTASACSSAAGRQPSPDREVVEIATGAKMKDHDFGPIPLKGILLCTIVTKKWMR